MKHICSPTKIWHVLVNLPDVEAGLEVLGPNRETFVLPLETDTNTYYPDKVIRPPFFKGVLPVCTFLRFSTTKNLFLRIIHNSALNFTTIQKL